jgi:hypothetical protein
MRPSYTVDASGLTRAWAVTVPGLCGPGNPLPGGVHLSRSRSPGRGVTATIGLIAPRDVDLEGAGDSARVTFSVRAPGSEPSARHAAESGARALAAAMRGMSGTPQLVTIQAGTAGEETWRLAHVHTVQGPLLTGDEGGEITFSVDGTFVWQPA